MPILFSTCNVPTQIIIYIFQLFKGEKNNGFDILYHNMKHGLIANKDLSDFLRER